MRARQFLGTLAVGVLALGSHGQAPGDKPTPGGGGPPVVASRAVPAELEALNRASRQLYAGGRAQELATVPAVIIVSGDDLILRRGGKRVVATVIPREYHALKCVAHSTLALFGHLSHEAGKPLGDERLRALKEYRATLAAAGPAAAMCGLNAEAVVRQKRIITRGLTFKGRSALGLPRPTPAGHAGGPGLAPRPAMQTRPWRTVCRQRLFP
jgi:hypothetical protein